MSLFLKPVPTIVCIVAVTALPAYAQDDCRCAPEHHACRQAVSTVAAVASEVNESANKEMDAADEVRAMGQLQKLIEARATLARGSQEDPERMRPRFWSTLAGSSFMMGDYASTMRFASRAFALHAAARGAPCLLDTRRIDYLDGLVAWSREHLVAVAIDLGTAGLRIRRISARIGAPSETIEYQPLPRGANTYDFNPGRQWLRVEVDGYEPYETEFNSSTTTSLDVHLIPTHRTQWLWAGVGLGALLTGVGAAIWYDGARDLQRANHELDVLCQGGQCASDEDFARYGAERHDAKIAQGQAIAGGVGTGLGAAITGYFLYRVFWQPRGGAVPSRDAPIVLGVGWQPSEIVLRAQGSF